MKFSNNNNPMIPSEPAPEYHEEAASRLLSIANTYLNHADRLIYSFGSKTFLSGYDLYDNEHENRGNIDCSTFIFLVLAGIPYEQSPYATGILKPVSPNPFVDMDFSCFSRIPDRYLNIAERIGRPYLSGPKGLDLEKAEAMGISTEQLLSEIQSCGNLRRSVDLAEQFFHQGACFTDPAYLEPGDIVFYQSKTFFKESKYTPSSMTEVTHVGMITQNTELMINSSGYLNKERAQAENLPAVSLAPVKGKRTPVFYARPVFTGL